MGVPHTVTASGLFSGPMFGCAELVAYSATWQSLVSAADAAEALNTSIYWPFVEDEEDANGDLVHGRPRCLIHHGIGKGAFETERVAFPDHWQEVGFCEVSFEIEPSQQVLGNKKDEISEFINIIQAVLRDIQRLSRTDKPDGSETFLNVRNIALLDGPGEDIEADENQELFYGVTFAFFYQG